MSESVLTIELNERERRLYDRVRARIVRADPGVTQSGLRDMLLLLPDLTMLLMRLMRDARVPRSDKLVALLGVGYVLSPIDLLPALLLGPIGMVDDLVVVSAALSRLVNHVHPDLVRAHWSGKGDALEAIQRVSDWCEGLLTRRLGGFLRGRLGLG